MTDQPLSTISLLLTKYDNDEYCKQKLHDYIQHADAYIQTQIKEKTDRELRKRELEQNRGNFIKYFLDNNRYFYIPDVNTFISYDGTNYTTINEDNIWGQILSTINKDTNLAAWKHKVRIELINIIKKQNILNTIPESSTIQHTLKIFTSIVSPSKDHAKYFLTIIGDLLLKKTNHIIYLVDPIITNFLSALQYEINKYCKCSITKHFKYKYYNHYYNQLRLIKLHDNIYIEFLWEDKIKKFIFNIISVCCYYSKRYESANNFIDTICTDEPTKQYVLYLEQNTKQEIVNQFICSYTQPSEILSISHREMDYLWKDFLKVNNLQPIMFHKELFSTLDNTIDHEDGVFIHRTSKKLIYVNMFCKFIQDELVMESPVSIDILHSFEISELLELFSSWNQDKLPKQSISEGTMVSMLQHFNEEIVITENKYVFGFKSKKWNKRKSVIDYLMQCSNVTTYKPILKAYKKYCKYNKTINSRFIVSKTFFEQTIIDYQSNSKS